MEAERQRVAVITGASSGIGKDVAKILASQGWSVVAHGRDPARSAAAEAEIRAAAAPGASISMVRGDLCELGEVVRMAGEILALTDRIDLLVNNAGGMRDRMALTREGNEITFAGNHLGHFLLTDRLLPRLRDTARSAPPGDVRVINVSSQAHEHAPPIDWDDLQSVKSWTSHGAYGAVKVHTILFTRELARRVADAGIAAFAVHPGVVDTNFASHGTQALRDYWAHAAKIGADDAASDIVWLATASDLAGRSGGYFHQRTELVPSEQARDDHAAARLWTESEQLIASAGL